MLRMALMAVLAGIAALSILSVPVAAQTYSCRGYPPATVLSQLKNRIEALHRIEREAADRLLGLDTRPYDWLLDQARTGESVIAAPALLAAEVALERCRNFIRPVRRDCALGATALVRVIEELVAGEATNEAKMAYAQTMPRCEQTLSIAPLRTTLRIFE